MYITQFRSTSRRYPVSMGHPHCCHFCLNQRYMHVHWLVQCLFGCLDKSIKSLVMFYVASEILCLGHCQLFGHIYKHEVNSFVNN